ncbi:hypothetical protein MRB53_037234 [Persea americana]|nr:hypothetical protein MRB53_037234 [Persea americana]
METLPCKRPPRSHNHLSTFRGCDRLPHAPSHHILGVCATSALPEHNMANHNHGQRHDRIDNPSTMMAARPAESETSLTQKMVSATVGSIFTSLLAPNVLIDEVVSDCAAEQTQRKTFNSTIDGLRKIARNEGVFTLWRGLSPTLAMAVPGNVIYFAGYDWLRSGANSPMRSRVPDAYAPLVAGSVARVLAAIAVGPIEMLRTRMQATQTTEKNVLRATLVGLKDMVGTQGYTSLWED